MNCISIGNIKCNKRANLCLDLQQEEVHMI
uniref:Uncharacterized protein n=1 Tax=Medicago truncatula TaxID=3880 RepID=I3SKV3_MEDTR|nr:unknown [Medicago truncatula]